MGDGTRKQGRTVKNGKKSGGRPTKKVADRKGVSLVNNTFDDLIKRHSKNAGPLFQRLLSAIILEDDKFDEVNEEWGTSVNPRSSSKDCRLYEQMSIEDRLVLELQSVGLFVETRVGNTKALTNFSKGKRTPKTKPKQKTAKVLNMDSGKEKEANYAAVQKTAVIDADIPMREEFRSDLGDNLDLSSWFNFDDDDDGDDDLEERDAVGLDIPMDDLTELMF